MDIAIQGERRRVMTEEACLSPRSSASGCLRRARLGRPCPVGSLNGSASSEPLPSLYLTVPEAAGLLRCKRQRVDDLLSQRRLTRVKDGRRTLLLRAEVEQYLAASAVPRRKPLRVSDRPAGSG